MNRNSQKPVPDFSVVIPALNLRTSLELILRCLEAQTYPVDRFECIIVDDGSTDGTRKFLESYPPTSFQLTFISHAVPQGRGAARNQGWRRAQGKVIVFLDGDTLPSPQWLSDYDRAFASGFYDVVSGGRYCIQVNPKREDLFQHLADLAQTTVDDLFCTAPQLQFDCLDNHAALSVYRISAFQKFELEVRQICVQKPKSILCAYSFVGANIAVRRKLLEETNGFDQFLRRAEDTDLGIRLLEAGARFGFASGANAYHQTAVGEVNRGLNPAEAMAFFYRHPYRMVLLIYLWFLHQLNPEAEKLHPAFENLLALAETDEKSSVDIEGEFQRLQLPPIPADCRFTKEELVNDYADVFGCPHSLISECIDSAVEHGLYTRQQGEQTFFDFGLTSNWLRYRAPLHEHELLKTSYYWRHRNALLNRENNRAPLVLACEGRYEIAVDSGVFEGRRIEAVLNMPLPIENEAQGAVKLTECFPPDLLSYVDKTRQMISRYPCPKDISPIRLSYQFQCEVKERVRQSIKSKNEYAAEPITQYLRPMLPSSEYPIAKMMLKRIMAGNPWDAEALPERIYYWILDNISCYQPPPGRTHIFDTGFGLMPDYARLFVNLCRLAAIPARIRCGALFNFRSKNGEHEKIEINTLSFSPFQHTWAEFYLRGQGWQPVDFCALLYGQRSLTSLNVYDPVLRDEIRCETKFHDAYYFRNLDPYRIYAHTSGLESPTSLEYSERTSLPAAKARSIRHNLQIKAECIDDRSRNEGINTFTLKNVVRACSLEQS